MISTMKSASPSKPDSTGPVTTASRTEPLNLRPEVIERFRAATGHLTVSPQHKPIESAGARSPAVFAWEAVDLVGRLTATGLITASAMIWLRCALATETTVAWLGLATCAVLVAASVRRLMAFFQNGTT